MHLPHLITDLALILGVAAIVTLLFKKLKQPVVLGYIIAGILVGPNFNLFPTVLEKEGIHIWAEIGVIFLLFSLGLEFSFKKLARVGVSASVTAVIEVISMLMIGFFVGKMLGWETMDCIFLGGILSVSSTTIIIRAFEEIGVKNRKFASLVFGVLIIEDLVAIVLMVLLSTLSVSREVEGMQMVFSLLKLLFFLTLWFIAGIFLIPTLLKRARSLLINETLLVLSVGLCLMMVVLAVKVGFSPALGAFVMGSILAETTFSERIEKLTHPVKDLFAAVFFVSVGMLIDPEMLKVYAIPISVITVATIVGKLFSTGLGSLISGQPLKQSIQAGMSMAQIGEFSFIIATLGLTLGVISDFLYPIAVAVSAVTTFTTPYLIRFSDPMVTYLENKLPARWLQRLHFYSSGTQSIKAESKWKIVFKSYITLIVVNSVVILSIITITSRYIVYLIGSKINDGYYSSLIACVIALVLMSPFLWALAIKKIARHAYMSLWLSPSGNNKGPLVMLEISRVALSLFFIILLIYQLFAEKMTLFMVLGITIFIILIFSRMLQRFYAKIEARFLANLNSRQIEKEKRSAKRLVPWDAHFAEYVIDHEFKMAGCTLQEIQLREKLGVNIVFIERGDLRINIPQRDDRLFPGDVISVVGTDKQLEDLKKFMDSARIVGREDGKKQVVLRQYIIDDRVPFIGKTIKDSRFRENFKAMVLGIERGNDRILNPASDLIFERNDMVWVVGDPGVLEQIFSRA